MTLDKLEPRRAGEVVALGGGSAAGCGREPLVQRLLAMGFLPGTRVRVVQVAPLGDPITVELNAWRVSLRRADARTVTVRPS